MYYEENRLWERGRSNDNLQDASMNQKRVHQRLLSESYKEAQKVAVKGTQIIQIYAEE